MMQSKKGFSLFELLIVVALIGGLLTILVLILGGKQKEIRDLQRLNDMRDLSSAFSLVKNETGFYDRSYCDLGVVSDCVAKGNSKLTVFLKNLKMINDPSGTISCLASGQCQRDVCNYSFSKLSENDYEILFHLEKGVDEYALPGCYRLTPNGISKI